MRDASMSRYKIAAYLMLYLNNRRTKEFMQTKGGRLTTPIRSNIDSYKSD